MSKDQPLEQALQTFEMSAQLSGKLAPCLLIRVDLYHQMRGKRTAGDLLNPVLPAIFTVLGGTSFFLLIGVMI